MQIENKLRIIQQKLKAPKSQYNNFGNYKYRSCEDILEAVKPLLEETKTILLLSDEVISVGARIYVKATAILQDCESEENAVVNGYAREDETKKGMDGSQITGASSSYARKYALNGLFAIDDTKDADAINKEKKPENKKQTKTPNQETTTQSDKKASPKQVELLAKNYTGENLTKLLEANGIERLEDITITKASEIISKIYGGNNGLNQI
jgi:hypothetical protein